VLVAEPLVRRALAPVPLMEIVWTGLEAGTVELSSTIEKVVLLAEAESA
jgi:hypothetical protein